MRYVWCRPPACPWERVLKAGRRPAPHPGGATCAAGRARPLYSAAMIDAITTAVDYIRSKSPIQPHVGVILGSGLGNVVDAVEVSATIPYGEIPGARAS